MNDETIIQLGSPGTVGRGVRLNDTYEIDTAIAKGGMGEVYKGFNIQTHDPVAIKMILPELASNPDVIALFRREASTLHKLQHEAIVRYFGFSVDPKLQRAYLSMEFVDGPSLTKRLAQGRLTLAEVTILRKRIAGALEVAHRFGVVHRDISSDNIILPGNDPRRAKIIDFGIARSKRPGEATIIGSGFAGKYNYVSPEQLGLGNGEVTAKSDIYSFGLVLAEALRGRPIDMNGTQVEIIEKRRSVPDLSDIDASMRPLLSAMLQPLPADRPDSMAAVAAWDEGGNSSLRSARQERGRDNAAVEGRKPEGGSAVGRIAAILGVLIVLGSVGGTLYVFRDAMPWNNGPSGSAGPTGQSQNALPIPNEAPEPPSTHKLPPLPDISASEANVAPNIPADIPSPTVAGGEIKTPAAQIAPHVPSADEIVQSLNEIKQNKANAAASAPTNGADHPGAEASASPVKPSLPDVAQKKGESAQSPTNAAPALPPNPPIASAPRAPQTVLAMADATVGKDYVADLPPFNDSAGAQGLVLRAEPNPPDGLTFADLGSGFGQISGKPSKPGEYSFEIIARSQSGAAAHMTTRIAIAPAPPPAPAAAPIAVALAPAPAAAPIVVAPEPPPAAPIVVAPAAPPKSVVASISATDKALSFMRDFDGGPCFLARPLGAISESMAIQGIGSDKATFERFYGDFIREMGVEPTLNVRLIGSAECPAVDLIRATGVDRSAAPKIDLTGYDVGQGKPLAGTIVNLAGRHLYLLLVSSDGHVYRLDSHIQPGGGSATFSVPITPDAASIEALQLLIAIASPKPSPLLEGFKAGAASDVLPRLRGQLTDAADVLDVEFFKLVK